MPQNKKIRLFAAMLWPVMWGCSGPTGNNDVAEAEPMLRLDRAIAAHDSCGLDPEMEKGWTSLAPLIGNPDLLDYSSGMAVKVFQPDVDKVFSRMDSLELVLGHVRESAGTLLPDIDWRRTYTVVWPYSQSVITDGEGNLYLALNHYLGADYAGYAGRFPSYMVANKRKEMLPVDATEALVRSSYPYVQPLDEMAPLVYRMIYEGAVAYAVKQLLPEGTADSTVLGMDAAQMEWLYGNEAAVWHTMMERQLVYDTDPAVADRLLRRAPGSPVISVSAPGQTACYMGLRIVEAYVRSHPDVTLKQMLTPELYNSTQTLIDSKYAPE